MQNKENLCNVDANVKALFTCPGQKGLVQKQMQIGNQPKTSKNIISYGSLQPGKHGSNGGEI